MFLKNLKSLKKIVLRRSLRVQQRSNGQSFTNGLHSTVFRTWTSTTRTLLSFPSNTFTILPKGHSPFGVSGDVSCFKVNLLPAPLFLCTWAGNPLVKPSMPKVTYKFLNATPSLSKVECFSIDTIACKSATHLTK